MKNLITKIAGFFALVIFGFIFFSCKAEVNVDNNLETVKTPSFSVTESSVDNGTKLEIICATSGAEIYYTTNGENPTALSTKYTDKITITNDVTIKAIALKAGMIKSEVSEKSYTVKKYTINFNNGGHGTAPEAITGKVKGDEITLPASLTETGYAFEKWTDGTNDYEAGSRYTVTENVTLTAEWEGWGTVQTPSFSMTGTVVIGSTVTISCKTAGVEIYYTEDGNDPTTSSTKYVDGIVINKAKKIKAIAVKEGMYNSEIITAEYKVKGTGGDYLITYEFTDSVRTLSGYTGTAGEDETYVEYGDWPQTLATITDFNAQPEANGYYVGSDGNYYKKCLEDAYVTNCKYADETTDVAQISEKSYKFFKVEPIKWRVADTEYDYDGDGTESAKLLIAENILTGNVPYYEDEGNNRTISGTVYPNNYMHSQIRAFLNGISYAAASSEDNDKWLDNGFLQRAFTDTAQQKIKTTIVKNNGLSTQDAGKKLIRADGKNADGTTSSGEPDYTCGDTEDKIFLLSEYEVTKYSTEAYDAGGEGNSRIRKTTDYAKANHAFQPSTKGLGGYWWLRSPFYNYSYFARSVVHDGNTTGGFGVNGAYVGVVPAMVISF